MTRFKITMSDAKNMQKWALEVSEAKKFLDSLPKLPKTKKINFGLYVSYEIDENEIEDDLIDYCTPEVASIWAVDSKGEKTHLGGIRVYHWETYWLEFGDDCEVDTAENWFDLIQKEYKKMLKSTGEKT